MEVKGREITIFKAEIDDYISLTDIVLFQNQGDMVELLPIKTLLLNLHLGFLLNLSCILLKNSNA